MENGEILLHREPQSVTGVTDISLGYVLGKAVPTWLFTLFLSV
jgi:hypothetical protein